MQVNPLPILPDEHPLDRAARYLGGRALMAEKLDVSPAAIGNWKARGVPIEKCVPIERLCPGVVGRKDLRDDWRDIWPELAANDAGAAGHTEQHPADQGA